MNWKMKKWAIAVIVCLGSTIVHAEIYDTYSDTWVCTDGLGRQVAYAGNGVSRTQIDTTVNIGMFYYIWHGQHGAEIKDITNLLAVDPVNPAWGGEGQFHWGGKPALGYYAGGNDFIIARHMEMLVDAGVDFYFFDVTNAFTYDGNVKAVMKEIDRRKSLGLKTPKLAFITHSSTVATVQHLYDTFYADSATYYKYWYLWNGKPLMLINGDEYASLSTAMKNYFTFRYSWAWDTGQDKWSWLASYPQATGYSYSTGKRVNEQISVSTAQHRTSKIGKSFHNGAEPAYDKYGLCAETPQGLYFAEQWNRALTVRPKVVMVTQWNEWMAQRFVIKEASEYGLVRPGATASVGETYFVDVYNQEFNRDIEPSSEPLIKDNYYLQFVSNARKYHGARPIPIPTVSKTIKMNGDFTQWGDVTPEFRDEPGDCYYTSSSAQFAATLLRKTNDFVKAKVTKDADSLYFYAAVANTTGIVSTTSSSACRWMTLLLNTDCDTTGWNGYDYMVSNDSFVQYLYRYDKATKTWIQMMEVPISRSGNEMMFGLSKADIGLTGDKNFDFKWIDNIPKTVNDMIYFVANGDAAPNGRFNYRYLGAKLNSVTGVKSISSSTMKLSAMNNGNSTIFSLQTPAAGSLTFKIFDLSGKEITSIHRSHVEQGIHHETLQLPAGTFVAKCMMQDAEGVLKFVNHPQKTRE